MIELKLKIKIHCFEYKISQTKIKVEYYAKKYNIEYNSSLIYYSLKRSNFFVVCIKTFSFVLEYHHHFRPCHQFYFWPISEVMIFSSIEFKILTRRGRRHGEDV